MSWPEAEFRKDTIKVPWRIELVRCDGGVSRLIYLVSVTVRSLIVVSGERVMHINLGKLNTRWGARRTLSYRSAADL